MSYILDALKKAESERKLGSIPNVYASAPTMAVAEHKQRWLPWILLAAVLLVSIFGLVWLQPWQPKTPTSSISNPAPIMQAPSPATAEVPAPPPVVPQVKREPAIVEAASKPKLITPHPVLPIPAHVTQAPSAIAAPQVPIKEQVVAQAPPEEESIGTARNLPQNIQAELPTIAVNGYIYARNPVDRSVLINQKLLHEGDQITPELILEKMLPKGAILNYKGYRYRVAF